MSVSPLDLRQRSFRSRLNGFDKAEVAAFLVAVADDYEHALGEADQLRHELAKMEPVLKEHRAGEKTLRNALLTAQRLSDEMKDQSEQEGYRIIRAAEDRAALLLEKTQVRLDEMQRDIDSLDRQRSEIVTTLEASIETLRNALEYVRDRADRETDDKILLHRPRQTADPPAGETASLDQARSR